MRATVQVDGLNKVINALQNLGVEVDDLKDAFQKIGNIVKDESVSLTPVLTGRLAASIRAGRSKNKATVRAGGAAVPYAGVIHYGGYNNIEGTYFLTTAAGNKADEAKSTLDSEIADLIDRLGLD